MLVKNIINKLDIKFNNKNKLKPAINLIKKERNNSIKNNL